MCGACVALNPMCPIPVPQYLQVGQACLAHSTGNGFDGGQYSVDELGQLPGRPLSLAAGLDDEPGQGPYVRVKSRLVRHAGFCSFCPSWWAADRAKDGQRVRDPITSYVLFIPRAMTARQGELFVSISLRVCVCTVSRVRGCQVSAGETGTA